MELFGNPPMMKHRERVFNANHPHPNRSSDPPHRYVHYYPSKSKVFLRKHDVFLNMPLHVCIQCTKILRKALGLNKKDFLVEQDGVLPHLWNVGQFVKTLIKLAFPAALHNLMNLAYMWSFGPTQTG
jgi:hypothetical protein